MVALDSMALFWFVCVLFCFLPYVSVPTWSSVFVSLHLSECRCLLLLSPCAVPCDLPPPCLRLSCHFGDSPDSHLERSDWLFKPSQSNPALADRWLMIPELCPDTLSVFTLCLMLFLMFLVSGCCFRVLFETIRKQFIIVTFLFSHENMPKSCLN